MKLRIPRQRTPEHDTDRTGPQCRLGCYGVKLDAQGLVKDHRPWYPGGNRTCGGSGQAPKGGASL